MTAGDAWAALDAVLTRSIREDLEERLWRPIEAESTFEVLLDDPAFFADPGRHPALFADHGVVHVRDVALGVLSVLDTVDAVLLPARPPDRRAFVAAVGVAAAYIHDIGMVDMSATGRRIHALYAAHAAFGPDVDPLVAHLARGGPVGERLARVAAEAPFAAPAEVIVREALSLAVAHSKTAVPAPLLDDRPALRALLQRVVFTSLDTHRRTGAPPIRVDAPAVFEANMAWYPDPAASFAWLGADSGPQAAFADDVIDAFRILRAADVLRQRGTVLRTSGGYEVCVDAATAKAVCTLRPADRRAAFVVTYDDERGAGEANIRVAFMTPAGNLRVAFHRGAFGDAEAEARAVRSVAGVIADIDADVTPSFGWRHLDPALGMPARRGDAIRVQLERPADRPVFAAEVAAEVARRDPALGARIECVADIEGAAPGERLRFHASAPVTGTDPLADELLRELALRGSDVDGIDRHEAFAEVRRARIAAGETLVGAGSPPAFVYVPMAEGLVVLPSGGYAPAPLAPWVPVGTTGVIRRAERNSRIVAEHDVEVVMIPAELYTAAWLRPLSVHDLRARASRTRAVGSRRA